MRIKKLHSYQISDNSNSSQYVSKTHQNIHNIRSIQHANLRRLSKTTLCHYWSLCLALAFRNTNLSLDRRYICIWYEGF